MQHKYFQLITESSPKIIGVKNGIQQVEIQRSLFPVVDVYDKIYSFFSTTEYWENERTIPDFPIHIYATTLKGAKLTDFMQYGPNLFTCPFLLHHRVVEIFSKFRIQPYELFPVTICDSSGAILSTDYYLFCSPLLNYQIINFSESVFFTGSRLLGKKILHFENDHEFQQAHGPFLGIEKMMLSREFDFRLDFFKGRLGAMYVSEALKDAIEILGFSGVRISKPVEPEILYPA